jgi:hypothetical protein
MKQKMNARQKREAENLRRKNNLLPRNTAAEKEQPAEPRPVKPAAVPKTVVPSLSPEEETREFLEYLAREHVPMIKDDSPAPRRKKQGSGIPRLNLEDGMPLVEVALSRMNMGIQEMRISRIKAVKLIHGYGSTGRGGKIRVGVRDELAAMKRRRLIKDFIPGEDFGPMNAASRKLAEQDKSVTRDPDYGRMNHGITVVVL